MPKSKFSAGLYLSLVFLSGALVGGLSYRLYSVNSVSAITGGGPKISPAEFRKVYIDSIRGKVHLDDKQVDQVNQILDETRAQFDQARSKSHAEIQAIYSQQVEKITSILRDDQKPAFAEFRAEREKVRQQTRDKQQKR